ncbi:MAG TPA: N,N-dimethylformamidase beta subunit family domain-containing protein [Gemmatimonadales bacterium]|nr:N,N-dimethylformamidase beta subunit family domain-containing protein [Gemmatimonadales bacterium]
MTGVACNDPLAPTDETHAPPVVIKPADTDSNQASILAENRRAGDAGWKDKGRSIPSLLAMWASPYAVSGGDTLDVYIHAVAETIDLQVYRLGWYGGVGGRLVDSQTGLHGGTQPRCGEPWSGIVACPWRVTTRLVVPTDWVGGVYLLKARDGRGDIWSYPFVLRSGEAHRFTAVINQFTWQAYNKWGGASFYTFLQTSTRYTYPRISFDRPYLDQGGMTATGGPDEAGGSNDLPAVRWLEANGYDVGYASDMDLADSSADLPTPHALLFVGHDEYWTWNEFDRVQALRDAGTHLAFLSGDNADWNIRVSAGTVTGRRAETLTCYKYQPDPDPPEPDETTTKFRDPPLDRPESELVGEIYQHLLPGGASPPMEVPPDSLLGPHTRAFTLAAGLVPGDTIAIASGTEGDQFFPGAPFTPKGTEMLLRAVYPVPDSTPLYFNSTFYVAPSGAGVWATGTNKWAAYLDGDRDPANPKVQALTRAVLDWMGRHG